MQRALQHSCNHLQYFSWCVLFPDAVHQNSLFFFFFAEFYLSPFSPLRAPLPPHRASRASINVRTAVTRLCCVSLEYARLFSTFTLSVKRIRNESKFERERTFRGIRSSVRIKFTSEHEIFQKKKDEETKESKVQFP